MRSHAAAIALVTVLLAAAIPVSVSHAGEHPRLLLRPGDLPRLRQACGLGSESAPSAGDPSRTRAGDDPGGVRSADSADRGSAALRAGRLAREYQALRVRVGTHIAGELLPGELPGAALLVLLEPNSPQAAHAVRLADAALAAPSGPATDELERILALDWCWPALDVAARRETLLGARTQAEPLTPIDSPLDARRFRPRLAALALALAVDEQDDPGPSWAALRAHLLESGRQYFAVTFPVYLQWRGASPTGSAAAAEEELLTALALELGSQVLERDLWAEHAATVGRWLEHYVLSGTAHPALGHGFLHDDGTAAPLLPVGGWRDLLPLTAHLLAARTRDPAAVLIAQRVAAAARGDEDPRAAGWLWVPIALDISGLAAADPDRLPAARNLGTALIFRGGRGADATAIWIDAAQPFLRRRQHFDAGHFLVVRGGHLAIRGGDDVAFEAVPGKGGLQRLGRGSAPFDFEQYFTATISHNCVLAWDPAFVQHWYEALYQPAGGQRPIEGTCTDFTMPLAAQNRETGRLLAYGQHDGAAYAALDLAAAYDRRAVTGCLREFVFLAGRVLVVIDRVALTYSRSPPTWVLNVPARPDVNGRRPADEARIAGSTNDGGVWQYDTGAWLRWTERDGALWLLSLRPSPGRMLVVGGPARRARIPEGPHADRPYIGGEADGYERPIIPADRRNAANAWYRLGAPTLLGPEFDAAPHWGRIEIEPLAREKTTVFVTVLVTDRADHRPRPGLATTGPWDGIEPPSVKLAVEGGELALSVEVGEDRAMLRFADGMERGGRLEIVAPRAASWTLPAEVEADLPLATR